MSHFDVFNGDADGLCALHQLRLAQPHSAQLVTGVKRDNALLKRVPARPGDSVTVLDIAMATNREALVALLEQGVSVEYFDHHQAGEPPLSHPGLRASIDLAPDVCTSVLVDRHLNGAHRPWAVVGAFGDALPATARALAATLGLDEGTIDRLARLGECLNYNSYGDTAADQMYRPEELYGLMRPYAEPLGFLAAEPVYGRLDAQYREDLERVMATPALGRDGAAEIYLLPDAPWARRIVGSFANRLKLASPTHAHAILVPNQRGKLTVSLRVPAGAAMSADAFARRHGGNGRTTAAGVTNLEPAAITAFADDFAGNYRDLA